MSLQTLRRMEKAGSDMKYYKTKVEDLHKGRHAEYETKQEMMTKTQLKQRNIHTHDVTYVLSDPVNICCTSCCGAPKPDSPAPPPGPIKAC